MRIFITGATGFIGRHLAARLAQDGHELRAIVRCADPGLDARIQCIRGRLDDSKFLGAMLKDTDAVLHLAGTTRAFCAQDFLRINQGLTTTLAEAFHRHAPAHAVLLYVSSQAACGPCAVKPGLKESEPANPVSLYGVSKLLGEKAVLNQISSRRVAVARPPIVYGPDDLALLPLYRGMARGFLAALGPSGQRLSIVHVDDLTVGLTLLLQALAQGQASGLYHFAGPESFTWEEYATAFGAALDRQVRVLRTPAPLLFLAAWINALLHGFSLPTTHLTPDKAREARAPGWLLDSSRAAQELGYAPRITLAKGAADVIAWCRTQGLLD